MVDEVCLGQIMDIDTTTREATDEELINEKTRLKTSRYTFVRPMQIGAGLANITHGMDDFCENLGTKLGVAFQLQDDLLDIIGDPKVLEKNILRDIADHQHTFFTNFVLEHGTAWQKKYFNGVFGKELDNKKREKIKSLFIESGAIKKGEEIIARNLEEAKIIINESTLEDEYKNTCLSLVKIMESRQN